MFELTLDQSQNLVVMRLTGFWNDTVIADFERALASFVAKLPRDKSLNWLIDSRDFPVQSQSITDRLAKSRMKNFEYERRLALVIPGMLSRMQVNRNIPSEQFFSTIEDARAWLAAEG